MAVNQRRKVNYGQSQPLINNSPEPIIAKRAPTINDKAQLGTVWVDTTIPEYFILSQQSAIGNTWLSQGTGAGIFAFLEATIGNITADNGDIVATAGDIFTSAGDINSANDINAVADLNVGGNADITGTIQSQGDITSVTGDIVAQDGVVKSEDSVSGDFSSLDNNVITAFNNEVNTVAAILQLQKSRGGAIVQAADHIGTVSFDGWDGAALHSAAFIESNVLGAPAAGRVAGNLEFWTAPDAVSAALQRVVIDSTGEVTINAPDSGVGLTIAAGGETITAGNLDLTAGGITAFTSIAVQGATDRSELLEGQINSYNLTNNTTGALFVGLKNRAGAIVQAADTLSSLESSGWDGVSYQNATAILSVVKGVPAVGHVAGEIQFHTAPDIVSAPLERMAIAETGEVSILAPDSGVALTIVAGGETITAGDLVVTAGDITASAGAITGGTLYAADDLGGVVGQTAVTNVFNNTQGVGVMTVLSTTGNPGNNAGFLKLYLGVTPIYIPYWTVINP